MLLHEVVETSAAVAGTRSRKAKVTALASCLRRAEPAELETVTAYLGGALRQRCTGIGWRGAGASVDPATAPSLTVRVHEAFDLIAALGGTGSQSPARPRWRRSSAGAPPPSRPGCGGPSPARSRQGALDALVQEAVASAAEVPLPAVRRAAMLAGGTVPIVVAAFAGGAEALATVGLEVGRPVLPMLASSAPDVAAAMAKAGGGPVRACASVVRGPCRCVGARHGFGGDSPRVATLGALPRPLPEACREGTRAPSTAGAAPSPASPAPTRMTCSVRGPWTPSTRSSSMSLVAHGPLIHVCGRAGSSTLTAEGTSATTWAARTTQTCRSGTRVSARRPWPGPWSSTIVPVSAMPDGSGRRRRPRRRSSAAAVSPLSSTRGRRRLAGAEPLGREAVRDEHARRPGQGRRDGPGNLAAACSGPPSRGSPPPARRRGRAGRRGGRPRRRCGPARAPPPSPGPRPPGRGGPGRGPRRGRSPARPSSRRPPSVRATRRGTTRWAARAGRGRRSSGRRATAAGHRRATTGQGAAAHRRARPAGQPGGALGQSGPAGVAEHP